MRSFIANGVEEVILLSWPWQVARVTRIRITRNLMNGIMARKKQNTNATGVEEVILLLWPWQVAHAARLKTDGTSLYSSTKSFGVLPQCRMPKFWMLSLDKRAAIVKKTNCESGISLFYGGIK